MEEELEMLFSLTKDSMEESIDHLEKELLKIRAGKANPAIFEGVNVEYYGTMTPLSQVSNINTPDARTLSIQPWEKSLLEEIERAIINSNLGLNPQNNGELIIISLPALTEERRGQLVKMARSEGENAKVSIRNARKDANDNLKKLQKDGLSEDRVKDSETEVQELTNSYSKRVDDLIDHKEKDIMTV
jgi:ribosome recycling factor